MRYPLTGWADTSGEAKAGQRRPRLTYAIIAVSALSGTGPAMSAGVTAALVERQLDGMPPHVLRVQGQGQPVLNVSKVILAEPATETPLPIQVGPPDTIARNSFIRLRGLPQSTALTEGHSIAPGAWAVPLMALANLRIVLPVGLSGKSEVTVALVTVDGTVVAETKTALVIAAASLIAPGEAEPRAKSVASLGPSGVGQPKSNDQPARLAPPPALSDEQKRAAGFITKGNDHLLQGNVAEARLYFQRAADAGLAQGALAMAATYDPIELSLLGARGVRPDPATAKVWYERARQLGATEAEERLKRLGSR